MSGDNKPNSSSDEQTTHFGYETVPVAEKAQRVGQVFHSVASKYDVMNDLMSLGTHRLVKRFTVELSGVRAGQRVLDLAGGTGDFTIRFSSLVGPTGEVVLADINASMLRVGRDRLIDKGISQNVRYTQLNAEQLPFAALRSMYSVLKPGGRALVLEFSKPRNDLVSKVYDGYSALWPIVGKLVTGDADSYRYLVESIRMHPDQETLKAMMESAGFTDCRFHDVMGGVCAIHVGFKPLTVD